MLYDNSVLSNLVRHTDKKFMPKSVNGATLAYTWIYIRESEDHNHKEQIFSNETKIFRVIPSWNIQIIEGITLNSVHAIQEVQLLSSGATNNLTLNSHALNSPTTCNFVFEKTCIYSIHTKSSLIPSRMKMIMEFNMAKNQNDKIYIPIKDFFLQDFFMCVNIILSLH